MERKELEGSNFKDALLFSAYPGIVVYNVVATLLIGMGLFVYAYSVVGSKISAGDIFISLTDKSPTLLATGLLVAFLVMTLLAIRNMTAYFSVIAVGAISLLSFIIEYIYIYIS